MLYLVATPIGNLEDITLRALHTLKSVDLIASEDTRRTRVLLSKYHIAKPQISYHAHNEARAIARIVETLAAGRSVAVVSDAGTPGISDPGYAVVRAALAGGYPVTMIPGATAFVPALVLSGLPAHSFLFLGFPPRRPGPRRRFLEAERCSPHTLILYESPYRIRALVDDAIAALGDRRAALANDLTKKFESVLRGTLSELADTLSAAPPRGEYVLLIAGATADQPVQAP